MSVIFPLESCKEVSLNWHVLEHTQSNNRVETFLVFGEPKGIPRTKLVFGDLERTPKTSWPLMNPKEHLGQSGCK